MSSTPQQGRGFFFLILGLGVASALAIIFGLRVLSEGKEGDSSSVPNAYLQVQQSAAITTIRKAMAEEFVDLIVNCIPPQSLRDGNFTKAQVDERIESVLAKFNAPDQATDKCGNLASRAWTFTPPCQLTINRPPAWLSGTAAGSIDLGDITICGPTMAQTIHAALNSCAASPKFAGCLVTAVMANSDVQREIDKPVDLRTGMAR